MATPATTITIPAGERAPLAMTLLAASDQPWAITPRAIRAMIRAVNHPDFATAYEAVAPRLGQPVDGSRGYVRSHNGVGVLDIRGPLFRYRSIWTWLLGGTAIEDAAIGLHAALDDASVRSIVLDINSPGGQIDGVNEFANMIRAAHAKKPITAYVGALAGSGAYWLASAAGRIVADETAQVGSIGVLATIVDDSVADEKHGIKRFDIVSSQSPLKRVDPSTDEGRDQMQQMVDALAQVFIAKVAKFRGASEARVEREYGRGAVVTAPAALTIGMVDALGSLASLLTAQDAPTPLREIRGAPGMRVAASIAGKSSEDDEEDDDEDDKAAAESNGKKDCPTCDGTGEVDGEECPDCDGTGKVDAKAAAGVAGSAEGEGQMTSTEERQRIAAILNCEEAKGRESLAHMLALDTDNSVDAARKILAAAPVAKPTTNALDARMAALGNPQVGVPADHVDADSPDAEARRILAFVPQNRLRPHARVQRVQ